MKDWSCKFNSGYGFVIDKDSNHVTPYELYTALQAQAAEIAQLQEWIAVCNLERKERDAAEAKLREAVKEFNVIVKYHEEADSHKTAADYYYDIARAFLATMERPSDEVPGPSHDEAMARLETKLRDADAVIQRLNSGAELQAITAAHNDTLAKLREAVKVIRRWHMADLTGHDGSLSRARQVSEAFLATMGKS